MRRRLAALLLSFALVAGNCLPALAAEEGSGAGTEVQSAEPEKEAPKSEEPKQEEQKEAEQPEAPAEDAAQPEAGNTAEDDAEGNQAGESGQAGEPATEAGDGEVPAGDDEAAAPEQAEGAAENEQQEAEVPAEIPVKATKPGLNSYVPGARGAGNDELFEGYVNDAFDIEAGSDSSSGSAAANSFHQSAKNSAGGRLSGVNLALYGEVRQTIIQIAAGETASTIIAVTPEDLGLDDLCWTAEELGVESILAVDENGEYLLNDEGYAYITENATNAAEAKIGIDIGRVINALLADCPYQLYWFDKVAGTQWGGFAYDVKTVDGEIVLFPVPDYAMTLYFSVAREYAGQDDWTVDPSVGQSVHASAENARNIVSQYAERSDYEKLKGYSDEICALVSYNDDAADGIIEDYGNPWQLVWVFDGDPGTNVVCEGYSKAFKYLCDQSSFDSKRIECITVSGLLSAGKGAGEHMWNVVAMSNGKNYLVDVTNTDSDTVGEGGGLFMAGTSNKLYDDEVETGQVFMIGEQEVQYTYDADTLSTFGAEELILDTDNYEAGEPALDDPDEPEDPEASAWLADYDYEVSGDRIILKGHYKGSETNVVVPGSAVVDGVPYNKVQISKGIWEFDAYDDEVDNKVTSLVFEEGVVLPDDCSNLFYCCSSLQSIDLSRVNTSNVMNMRYMFAYCYDLEYVDFSNFDTSNVTNMSHMFPECVSLTSLDLSSFDTSKVTDMSEMFCECSSLTDLDVSSFDTSKVTDFNWMFSRCYKLENLDVSGFDTSSATGEMSYMFYYCSSLTSLDVSNFDTSGVEIMGSMFQGCSSLKSLDLSSFDTSNVTYMGTMFKDCSSLTSLNIGSFNTSKVTNMMEMFYNCKSLKSLDVSSFDISSVENLAWIFCGCEKLTELNLSNFDMSGISTWSSTEAEWEEEDPDQEDSYGSRQMFKGDTRLARLYAPVGLKTDIPLPNTFEGPDGTAYTTLPKNLQESILLTADLPESTSAWLADYNYEVSGDTVILSGRYKGSETDITIPGTAFVDGDAYHRILISENLWKDYYDEDDEYHYSYVNTLSFESGVVLPDDCSSFFEDCGNIRSIDLSKIDTSNVTNMVCMFSYCYNLTSLNLSNLETGNVENMCDMFAGCCALTDLQLGNWDTSNVRDMSYMFYECSSLTGLDLSSFDTSNVRSMSSMFSECTSLSSLDLSSFDTSNVQYMGCMFSYCGSLTSLDLHGFHAPKVRYMNSMFYECGSLTSLDLSAFNAAAVEDMDRMFYGCTSLTELNLSNFNLSELYEVPEEFISENYNLETIYTPTGLNYDIGLPGVFRDADGNTYTKLPKELEESLVLTRGSAILAESITAVMPESIEAGTVEPIQVTILPENVTDKSFDVYSSDPDVLDVSFDENGNAFLLGKREGTATVTALTIGDPELTYSQIVTVTGTTSEETSKWLNDYEYEIIGDKVVLTGHYRGTSVDVVVPGTAVVDGIKYNKIQLTSGIWGSYWDDDYYEDVESFIKSLSFQSGVILPSNCEGMFSDLTELETIDLSSLGTGNVTNMGFMFRNCRNLTSVDVSGFYTGNVRQMAYMFSECSSLTEVDLSGFDMSGVRSMNDMFEGCTNLERVQLGNPDTSSVRSMNYMFYGCGSLTDLDVSGLDTSKVTDMSNMFSGCCSLTSLDVSHFDTSNVEMMDSMFYNCRSLTDLDVSGFDTSRVYDFYEMFAACHGITELDLGSFSFSSVDENWGVYKMFHYDKELRTIIAPKGLTHKAALPSYFLGEDGEVYENLPQNLEDTMRLVWYEENSSESGDPYTRAQEIYILNDTQMNVGSTVEAMVEVLPEGTSNKHYELWSENEDILSVTMDEDGEIYYLNGLKEGYATVAAMTADGSECYNELTIHVIDHKYDKYTFTVAFNANGGTGKMKDLTGINYRNGKALTANAFKRKGYTFIGWNTKKDGSGTYIANKGKAKELTKTNKGKVTLYAQWEKVIYTITYKNLTYTDYPAENNEDNPYTYTVTDTVALKNPTRVNYTFGGWYSDTKFKNRVKTIAKGNAGNKVLYAKWSKNAYQIQFIKNGATGGTMKNMTGIAFDATKTLTANAYTRKGYRFTGWKLPSASEEGEDIYFANKASIKSLSFKNGDVIKLYAQWEIVNYNINYTLNGGHFEEGLGEEHTYTVLDAVTLKKPVRTGYTFAGWYSDKKFKKKVTAIAKGSVGNKTFYAKWNANKYTVIFNKNNESYPDAPAAAGTMKSMSATYNGAQKLTKNAFTRKGYTFTGWNTVPVPTEEEPGIARANQAKAANLTAEPGGKVTLYAQWKLTNYKINYNVTADVENPNPATYTMADETFTIQDPVRPGYDFVAWYTDAKLTKKATNLTITQGTIGAKTFYPKWTAHKYTVVFDKNDEEATGTMKDQTLAYGSTTKLTANAFKKTYYTMTGWNTEPDGSGQTFANQMAKANVTTENGATVTLYAQWAPTQYKITYKLNSGKLSGSYVKTYTHFDEESAVLPTPTRSGYIFQGWYTDSKFKASTKITEIPAGSSGNRTVYAKWKKK